MKTPLKILSKSVMAALLTTTPLLAMAQESTEQEPAKDDIEVIAVKGTFSSNLIKALDEKRFNENVVDVVLAEDIGKFPDLTTSDALQRIPGVQVARGAGETNGVVIRGLPNVTTTIEGRSIFSTTSRGFAFQDLPAEALAGVEVYKSRSAEQVAGGIAGLVNIKLRNPFDFEGFKGAVSGRITDDQYAEDKDKVVSGLLSDRWKVNGQEFGALVNVSYMEDNFQQTNSFTAETLATDNTPTGETIGVPLSVGLTSDKGQRERMQANVALQWRPNDTTEVYLDSLYAGLDHQQHTIFGIGFVNGNQITDYTFAPNNDLCTDIGAADPVCYTASGVANNSQFLAGTHAITSDVDISQTALGVKWDNQQNLKIKSELVYTDTQRDFENFIQDWHFYGVDVAYQTNDDRHSNFEIVGGGTQDPANFVSGGLFQPWDSTTGEETAFTIDAEYELEAGIITKITGGIRYATHDADQIATDSVTNDGPGPNNPAEAFGPDYLTPVDMGGATYLNLPGFVAADYEYMLDHKPEIRDVYGLSTERPAMDPTRSFYAKEDITAGYVQASYDTEVAGYRVDGRVGVRVSQVDRDMRSYGTVDGVVTEYNEGASKTDVLPNANANIHFTDDVVLRAAVSKTVSRPAFGDLNPNLSYTPPAPGTPVGYGGGGNPDLDPIESTSYDLSLEYYPEDGGIVSGAIFYRDISGYISTLSTEEIIDGQTYYISRPYSSGEGYLQGVELSYTKFFKELPAPFDGLGVQLNYTYIDGETTVPDGAGGEFKSDLSQVSKNNGNAVLIYESGDLFARVAYNYRGEYIETFSAAGIQEPGTSVVRATGRVDASIGYNVTEDLTITLDGTNLNNEKFYNYWGMSDRSRDRRDPGRTVSVGVSYQF
ncbi:TonB-dependent receptor [Alteromonas pelagimontana]|uniref:TonB-dependent receptor n=1 Tax=Alteromonas pelagimontana TaxID=1858656 RepID=A0A6M4ME41_9ALTE|nr:TonB-dependent receptor [Alteromonas pelagimontana]QJR81277.1 TonB-dependent receptor [Alteromonas pelagimontana]